MKPYCGKCKKQTTWHRLFDTFGEEPVIVAIGNTAISSCCNSELYTNKSDIGKDPVRIEYLWIPANDEYYVAPSANR